MNARSAVCEALAAKPPWEGNKSRCACVGDGGGTRCRNELRQRVSPRSSSDKWAAPEFNSPARVLARAESEKLSDASARVA